MKKDLNVRVAGAWMGTLLFLGVGLANPGLSYAEKRTFEMTIEDTKINLADKQAFHTFAFNGQVPAPLFHVREGDEVTVNVNNLTTLPHSIHWHGLLQKGTWQQDGRMSRKRRSSLAKASPTSSWPNPPAPCGITATST